MTSLSVDIILISLDIMTVESNDSDWVILLDTCCSGNSLAAVAWCFYKCLFREVVFSADSFLLMFRLRFSSFIIKRQGVATAIIILESSWNKMNQWPKCLKIVVPDEMWDQCVTVIVDIIWCLVSQGCRRNYPSDCILTL